MAIPKRIMVIVVGGYFDCYYKNLSKNTRNLNWVLFGIDIIRQLNIK